MHPAVDDALGWRRRHEFWVKPNVWREIFDNNPDVAVDAARTLREIGLLRVQDTDNCQAVVIVRNKKSARAYVVKSKILEWQPTEPYGIYGPVKIGPPNGLDSANSKPVCNWVALVLRLQGQPVHGALPEKLIGHPATQACCWSA